jgi:hypothetical protein
VIATPLLPDFPAKLARGHQDGVAGLGTRALVLPWFGVLASGDNRMCRTLRNRFVTAFGAVGPIAADARDYLVCGNLVEQERNYWCIAGAVVCHFDSLDFHTPSPSIDTRAVDREVQSRCRRLHSDRYRKMLLATADGTEVGNLLVQISELEQALCHAHRLAQAQIEQALNR